MFPIVYTKTPHLGKRDPNCIVMSFDNKNGFTAYFDQTPEQAIALARALIEQAERATAEARAAERAQEIALRVLAIVRQPAAEPARAA